MRLVRRLLLLTAVAATLATPVAAASATAASAATGKTPTAARAGAVPAVADQGDLGWVRCANLSTGAAEQVYLYPFGNPAHPTLLSHQSYGGVSSYMPLSAGQYTLAVRPLGASASSPASISTSFMVSAGINYTVASIGSGSSRKLHVLQDRIAAPTGQVLVRVIQASTKHSAVTVSIGSDTLASQLASGSTTSYQTVRPGTPTATFSAPDGHAAMPVSLPAGSVHTIVVLDGTSGLKIDNLTDAVGSQDTPKGGAATGFGGTAPVPGPGLAPWLVTLAGGLLLAAAGGFGLRRSRRPSVVTGD
jgi:hypothetical protein